jgi:PHD/YefM family antitoxin component YafN of YafNO toxin-antitoxin module
MKPKYRYISTSRLKSQLTSILKNIDETGQPYIVFRYNKPIAMLIPPKDWECDEHERVMHEQRIVEAFNRR